ncbi:MAG: hypothetical protein ACOCX1_06585 [Fimbriimonadaceae bacterium]
MVACAPDETEDGAEGTVRSVEDPATNPSAEEDPILDDESSETEGGTQVATGEAADYVGSWKGKMELPEPEAGSEDEFGDEFARGMMDAMAESMALQLKEDMTFEMTMIFPLSDTWVLQSDQIVLTVTEMMGMSVEDMENQENAEVSGDFDEPMILEIANGGDRLVAQPQEGQEGEEGELYFVREA